MSEVFANTRTQLADGGHVLIVVNDSQNLYPTILDKARRRRITCPSATSC